MIAWLLAFLVHSTLWLSLAWLCVRLRPGMHARLRETVWYTAIAASLLAPTAQTLAPAGTNSFWALSLPQGWWLHEAGPVPEPPAPAYVVAPHRSPAVAKLGGFSGPAAAPEQPALAAWPARSDAAAWSLRQTLITVWAALAGFLLLRYASRLVAMRRRLEPRERVESAPEEFALAELCRRARLRRVPRLTESENIGSPVAFGFGRAREICLPTRALHELDHDQFCAMLGHEVAHHMRRDPLRLLALQVLSAVFFFQPLFRLAGRQLHLAAEEQCDAWGAGHSEDRLAMARCLTEVAGWVLPQDRRLLVAGMARRRSQLGTRVERLLDESHGFESPGGSWRALGSAVLLALAPWLAPTLAPAQDLAPIETTLGLDELSAGRSVLQLDAQIIDALGAELENEILATLDELGPLAELERYRDTVARLESGVQRIRECRILLRHLLAVLFVGDAATNGQLHTTTPTSTTNR